MTFRIHSSLKIMQAAHTVYTYTASLYHQRRCWKVSLFFSLEATASVINNKNIKFGLIWPWIKFRLLKWVLAHRTGVCLTIASISFDRALVALWIFWWCYACYVMLCRSWELQSICNLMLETHQTGCWETLFLNIPLSFYALLHRFDSISQSLILKDSPSLRRL